MVNAKETEQCLWLWEAVSPRGSLCWGEQGFTAGAGIPGRCRNTFAMIWLSCWCPAAVAVQWGVNRSWLTQLHCSFQSIFWAEVPKGSENHKGTTASFLEGSPAWDLTDHSRPDHKFYCWGIKAEGKAMIWSELENPRITWSRNLDGVQPPKALLKLLTRSIPFKNSEAKIHILKYFQ